MPSLEDKLSNRHWRLANLYWITNKQGEKVKFKPNFVQRKLLKNLWYLNVILKARQEGISTLISLVLLDALLFNENQTAGIVDKGLEDAKKKLDKMKFAYDHLDDEDDPELQALGAQIKGSIPFTTANREELRWANGSSAWCGTSLRGGTVQYLHISELGFVSMYYPRKAEEIRSGALNAIATGQFVFIESTHEGGKHGLNWEMCKLAMDAQGEELTAMDWRFHFFAWWEDAAYTLKGYKGKLEDATIRYFEKLKVENGIEVEPGQQIWWQKKAKEQKEAMGKEYPSCPEEAFTALIKGSIYGRLVVGARAAGRVRSLAMEPQSPVYTFWDIGMSDSCVILAIQMVGREVHVLDCYQNAGKNAGHYAGVMRGWDKKYNTIAGHFLPHDANKREAGSGQTFVQHLTEGGLENITVVPRTPDLWVGIFHVRDLIPRMWFNSDTLEQSWEYDEQEMPSFMTCIEAYRTAPDSASGVVKETPVHDRTSHACDALRTFGEASLRGMLPGASIMARASRGGGVKVITGLSDAPQMRKRKVKVIR